MSERSYTPGPWVIPSANVFRVIALRDGLPHRVIVKDTAEELCWYGHQQIGWLDERDSKESAANARLIAAAPEMFELLETIENDDGSVPPWLWERIQEVVKRVKGDQ